jgi:hypothetical protein
MVKNIDKKAIRCVDIYLFNEKSDENVYVRVENCFVIEWTVLICESILQIK